VYLMLRMELTSSLESGNIGSAYRADGDGTPRSDSYRKNAGAWPHQHGQRRPGCDGGTSAPDHP